MFSGVVYMTKWMMAALAAFLLSGCVARIDYVPLPAPCPVMPPLPRVSAQELQPLSDDAYRRLVERELRLKEYIGQMRALCEEAK